MNDAHGAGIRPGKTASRPSTLDRRAKTAIAAALIAVLGVGPAEAANTFFVNTTGDPGPAGTTSLRQAVAAANAGDTIKFDAALYGSTITLAGGEIGISKEILIEGPGSGRLTISGNDASRVFNVNFGDSSKGFSVYDVSLVHGKASAGCGGAVVATDSFLQLTGVRVDQNSALSGGGICVQNGRLAINSSAVVDNSATSLSGGGITFSGPNSSGLQVAYSTISGNEASLRGGGIYVVGGVPSNPFFYCDKSTISGNRVTGSGGGGGMFLGIFGSAQSFIRNSTIAQNYAHSGGGGVVTAYAATSQNLSILNSTIVSNTTLNDADGNGLRAVGAQLRFYSSIAANNSSAAGTVDLSGSFNADNSLVRNAGTAVITGSANLFGADPLLGTLANHGGGTKTMVPAADSPVINSGLSDCFPNDEDQRLFERCVGVPDIGAVERQGVEDFVFRDSFDLP